jgi:glycerol kinase
MAYQLYFTSNTDIWKSREDLERYYKVEKVFLPKVEEEESVHKSFLEWENALERFLGWSKTKT